MSHARASRAGSRASDCPFAGASAGPAREVRALIYPAAFTAWISSAATFCASP